LHELGIAAEIVEIAVAEARRHGGRKVTAVNLKIGVLRGIVPEHLAFLFGHVARDTIAEGAKLSIEEETVRVDCRSCGTVEAGGMTLDCPACGGVEVEIQGGDAMRIVSLEVEE
jgi:hydrogenase nickel incorporation protein HypA/HybF